MTDSTKPPGPGEQGPNEIAPVLLEEEMKRSYLDYAMSVIVARALPDVRDGLKPVHRRILYAMHEAGYAPDRPHRKSARVVGDVMGKYHPHGDAAIYDAMVRMAQPFAMRLPLIDGQGNFGSMDGDPPAAMRYTEVRLARAAQSLLEGIDEDTVDFQPNYDETAEEPRVLPAAFPNLLVNGANGIAVGMATSIPTHNLAEVIDATVTLIDEPEADLARLMEKLPGPDFPTGGIILGRAGIRAAFETGRGAITVRARATVEEIRRDREAIVVTEIPYQVNKSDLLEQIAALVREKRIEGITDIRDESDREGVRVVIEVKRDANAEIVLNQLYRFTRLQTSFPVQMLALAGGRPEQMGLKAILQAFLAFRDEVLVRRSRFRLARARERAHALIGLAVAVANIDAVIALIRASADGAEARAALMARDWPAADLAPLLALVDDPANALTAAGTLRLTEAQARAILDLRLQRLTGLERDRIAEELSGLAGQIEELLALLAAKPRRLAAIREELIAIKAAFPSPRRTVIEDAESDLDDESLVEPAQMLVTLTREGFIKRVPLSAFRAQKRGGRGRTGMTTREEDAVTRIFVANNLDEVLFFTSRGRAYRLKVWRLPEAPPQGRGRNIRQLLGNLEPDESISAVLPLPSDEALWDSHYAVFATSQGNVRRNRLSDFRNVRQNGLIAMKLENGERLIDVQAVREDQDVLLATRRGRAIRFPVAEELRVFAGRTSTGVRGIRLAPGDEVISLSVLTHVEATAEERVAYLKAAAAKRRSGEPEESLEEAETAAEITLAAERLAELERAEEFVLTVTSGGYGKRTSAYEYRVTARGGQGITGVALTRRNGGAAVASFPVRDGDALVLVTDAGRTIRIPVDDIRIAGRATQGVMLFRIEDDEHVTSVFRVVEDEAEGEAA
ncbi:DNA gyrase subunit A [Elioraea sp. Yellowstone]|uniref:DNA gyrase subunit A n=1 Tax=Elioraea sp. Yellowstone TaxID=2592070 RepID=UPI00114E050D|nr:DNA gyrase subunit A [Elioraea sp. Yellowstone]TQF76865.1 DNA gyrase subunit A [Elioraea sp. Yellowstone]